MRRRIDGRYFINDANRLGFTLAAYDRNYPLVIDPELVYSTYLGGARYDMANGIAVDSAGNAYITGNTSSTDFPTLNPLQPTYHGDSDAFVTKITFQVSLTITKSAAPSPVLVSIGRLGQQFGLNLAIIV